MMSQQPLTPVKTPANKPSDPVQATPAKGPEQHATIERPIDPSKKEQAPVETQLAPEIPVQQPPGAKIAVAAAPPAKNFQIGSILEPALWLIGILAFGAILIAWLKKSKEKQLAGFSVSPHEQLSAFRDSMEQGDMTDEEFKKVKALLADKIRKPPQAVPPAPQPEHTASPATPSAPEAK
ncbi:MAG TPA: hypothetical protein PLX97_03160 [Gemmatales bacterium]|nr:hypothetical protein [Gemmatales bacterium]